MTTIASPLAMTTKSKPGTCPLGSVSALESFVINKERPKEVELLLSLLLLTRSVPGLLLGTKAMDMLLLDTTMEL